MFFSVYTSSCHCRTWDLFIGRGDIHTGRVTPKRRRNELFNIHREAGGGGELRV